MPGGFTWLRSRRTKVLLAALITTAIVATAYGIMLLRVSQTGPRATIISPPIEFSMELDKAEYQYEENVTITISMKNVGNDSVTVSWPSYSESDEGLWYFDFIVMDVNGTTVCQWYYGRGLLESVLKRTLGPGEQLTTVYHWEQDTEWPDFAPVPRGTYSVKGLSRAFGLKVGNQTSMTPMELETPTITFTIT